MRKKQSRGLRRQTRQLPCPCCGKHFTDVLRHLNHRDSKCANWFSVPHPTRSELPPDRTDDISDTPSFATDSEPFGFTIPDDSNTQPPREEFSAAGETYGHTKSFLDRFRDDKYAPHRVQNPHYPFADQEEWELGSFLLESGMSMQKVDEFLKLKLVFYSRVSFDIVY